MFSTAQDGPQTELASPAQTRHESLDRTPILGSNASEATVTVKRARGRSGNWGYTDRRYRRDCQARPRLRCCGDRSVRGCALCRATAPDVQDFDRLEADIFVRLTGEAHLGDLVADDLRSFSVARIE